MHKAGINSVLNNIRHRGGTMGTRLAPGLL